MKPQIAWLRMFLWRRLEYLHQLHPEKIAPNFWDQSSPTQKKNLKLFTSHNVSWLSWTGGDPCNLYFRAAAPSKCLAGCFFLEKIVAKLRCFGTKIDWWFKTYLLFSIHFEHYLIKFDNPIVQTCSKNGFNLPPEKNGRNFNPRQPFVDFPKNHPDLGVAGTQIGLEAHFSAEKLPFLQHLAFYF